MTSVRFACPDCRRELSDDKQSCPSCARTYALIRGVMSFAPAGTQSAEQAAYFDEAVDDAWEIARPHGAPALYRWLIAEKFRRSADGLPLSGASVLAVCAGSGMDAEFLARAGAREVVAADVSARAAQRTAERARLYNVAITPVVADVERLPFADRAFDIVYVHDGLHHLENPYTGLAEMARVARHAVSVTEPARALATAIAVKLRVADDREEAGNRVARLNRSDVTAALERAGFRVTKAERYAMFYRHQPGAPMRALSLPVLLPLARGGLRGLNAVGGRFGNKLIVIGLRA